MGSNHTIIVRVTKSQLERIRSETEASGYNNISTYIRALALEPDSVHAKINEIYRIVKKAEVSA